MGNIDIVALATMPKEEALKYLANFQNQLKTTQERELREVVAEIVRDAKLRIGEIIEANKAKNIPILLNGVLSVKFSSEGMSASYNENVPVVTNKLPKNAIGNYRDDASQLIGKAMYFNLNGIRFNVSLNQAKIWTVIHDEKPYTADAPSTLIRIVSKAVFNKESNQSGWNVIRISQETEEEGDDIRAEEEDNLSGDTDIESL